MGSWRQARRLGRWSLIIGTLLAALAMGATASASVWTDQADYSPGDVVTISGDNSNDAGYLPGETVHVDVSGPNGYTSSCEATVADDGQGSWSCQVTLGDGTEAFGQYEYTATGLESETSESGTFTDAGIAVRAVNQNGDQIEVTFQGDPGQNPPPNDAVAIQYDESTTCTGHVNKWLPADETTNDAPSTLAKLLGGLSVETNQSISVEAPSPVTDDGDTYVFSSWQVTSGATLSTPSTTNPACFNGFTTGVGAFIRANYVLAGAPDLTATKTNDISGSLNAGDTFAWTIRVENEGESDATFADGDKMFLDDLPSGPDYGTVTDTPSGGVTGNIDCEIVSNVLTCVADGAVTIPGGDYVDISFDVTVGLEDLGALDNPTEGGTCTADPDDVVDEDNDAGDAEQNNDCSDSMAVTGALVTRGGCTFDLNTETPEETFRNIFTPDMNTSSYKLFATNPGQLFLNVATFTDGDPVDVNIPYPFVTQGATPVHVYGDWTTTVNDKVCFDPSDQLWTQDDQVALDDYQGTFGSTRTIEVVPPEGFEGWIFIRIHLNYGLKGVTGCAKEENDDATGCDPGNITIPDGQEYEFSFDDLYAGDTTIDSQNVFKRINGVAGTVLGADQQPLAGTTVQIWQGSKLWKTVSTDEDGWYMALFKYTGKSTTFTVKWVNLGVQQSITLKSNGFALVNYFEGVSNASIISDSTTTDSGGTPGTGNNGKGKQK